MSKTELILNTFSNLFPNADIRFSTLIKCKNIDQYCFIISKAPEFIDINLLPKFFFTDRDTNSNYFAFGKLNIENENIDELDDINKYSSLAFSDTLDRKWESFETLNQYIPRIEFNYRKELLLRVNIYQNEDIDDLLLGLQNNEALNTLPNIQNLVHQKSKDEWTEMINDAKTQFNLKKYQKIALSRISEASLSDECDPYTLFSKINNLNPNSFNFLIQADENSTFFGASPELFYKRNGRNIICDALAGTLPRGKNDEEDNKLKDTLLTSKKNIEEHQYVVDGIVSSLENITESVSFDKDNKVKQTATVQHLWRQIKAQVKTGVSDNDIINTLHPTPAVGTLPKDDSLSIISEIEKTSRGHYAAPIGIYNNDCALFAVALRCGLIYKDKLYLYSGAGIVPDSEPEIEWQEINNKMKSITRIFNDRK